MADLLSLQQAMAGFVLTGEDKGAALGGSIRADGLPALGRMQIYRNNFLESLCASLMDIFPVATVFVGKEFMAQALKVFVQAAPPEAAVLHLYGRGFFDFLRQFEPAQSVPYVADLAALEWATHELMLVDDAVTPPPLEACLQAAAVGALRLAETVRVIESRFPIFDLWLAGTGQIPPEEVDMDKGGEVILVALRDGQVLYEPLEGPLAALAGVLCNGWPVPGDMQAHIPALTDRRALAILEKGNNVGKDTEISGNP
jgi:hypothetical protein